MIYVIGVVLTLFIAGSSTLKTKEKVLLIVLLGIICSITRS